ncbi:twin-arginine translocation signal domain-containing protein [Indioceanicola profundi]|uniref:twin-arginine translocation signal domain-containing protein n=1 Tax=Indioceanicola profundi TaxID=2220096 RepID=UPI000E6A95FA|nr:twin-arginine translocation signal domain-containing protein [Indioceanicola profundi]
MSGEDSKKGLERRNFLKAAGLAGVGAAAGAAAAVAAEGETLTETPEEQIKSRYRETAHVQRFYFLNRL